MSKTHIVIPDYHAKPGVSNERAKWIGQLILDVKPDTVINIGDAADLPSLCSYDKGTRAAVGRTYKQDIDSHLEAQDLLWSKVRKKKKKLPRRVFLHGNHENRIAKAIDGDGQYLRDTVSFSDLELGKYYQDVVPYNADTPGIITIDGITYAHYFISGVMGRPIGGDNIATSILNKMFTSCTAGHTHTLDYAIRTTATGKRIQGMVCGHLGVPVETGSWAGESERLWWSGIVIKRQVDDGQYDPQFISYAALKEEYGNE